jgi:hypothetical protein
MLLPEEVPLELTFAETGNNNRVQGIAEAV